MKHRFLPGHGVCSVVIVAGLLVFGQSMAAEPTHHFTIPRQDLATALEDFGRQSGNEIFFNRDDTRGKLGTAVEGDLVSEDALAGLLAGTGLVLKKINSHTYVVEGESPSTPPATQQVPQQTELESVVVTGFRHSLKSAEDIKKNSNEVVDAIVAEDIGKLPDNNLSEALQRIPGVQMTRNHGEGSGIAIRGLSQVKTLLNGREIYSDTDRNLSLENVPAEILSGVDVFKNPSARLIEGGLGGVINLKTRKPFDFDGFTASLSARANYYDMLGKTKPQVSTLISDRWESAVGEVGALLGAAYLKSGGRFDQIGIEPFADRYDLADFNHNGLFPGNGSDPGDLVVAPRGGGNSVELTDRDRIAVNGMVQWRPSDDMDLFLEGVYNKYKYTQDSYVVFANRGSLLPLPGADFTFYPDTNVVRTGAYRDVQFTSNTNYFDRDARTWQIATGGSWHPTTRFQLATDLSYTKSQREDLSGSLRIGNPDNATGTTLNFDTGAALPVLALSGFDVNNPALYSYINSSHSVEATRGSGYAGQVDGTYELNDVGLQRFIVGVRYAKRDIERSQGTQNHIPSGTRPGSLLPEGLVPITYGSFFRGTPTPGLTGVLAPPASLARDIDLQCAAFGDTVCFPQLNPLNTYEQSETVKSVYGQLDFRFDAFGMPLDGNLGARYLWTNLGVDGFRTSTTGSSQPINQDSGYTDLLPSLNARLTLVSSVYLRFAAAKQLTRPNFSDLSPNLSLSTQTAIGLTGQAGNPDLKPLRATSYDLGLEWYFSDSGYTYLAGFLKDVDGFIQTVTSVEPVSLPDYPTYTTAQITRPQNGANGKIKGFEAGVQSFFDFLPSPFDGFGVQANYTYVNSSAPGPIAGTSVPLVGLSPHSYNLVAFYEKNAFRARVAYNWRDDYVDTTAGPGSGSLPIFAKPYGVLDASIGYHLNQHVDVSVDASNLTRARFSTYFGQEIRPRFTNIFDRTFGLVVHVSM